MKFITKTVNEAGLEEIRAFLLENHKKPDLYVGTTRITMDMLRAWAADAEFQLGEGNPASIELKSWDSVHGRTQTFTVSAAGLHSEEHDDGADE